VLEYALGGEPARQKPSALLAHEKSAQFFSRGPSELALLERPGVPPGGARYAGAAPRLT
jgi:hypothetical protein